MNETKKSRPSVAAPGRQRETGTYGRASTSYDKHTTLNQQRQQGFIAGFLSRGAENAVSLRHLVQLTQQPARQVRRQIQVERLQGIPILADNQNGYYLPEDEQDVEEFVTSMFHRAYEITRVANAVKLRGRLLD